MLLKSSYKPALALLADASPEVFATCELTARRYMLEATAYYYIGPDSEVDARMKQAEEQCVDARPILIADLATRRGMLVDDWPVAEKDYAVALAIARSEHDKYRETGALLNLGQAALNQEHYDEAIQWSEASLLIAQHAGFKLLEEKADVNLGFEYYKLGDFDQALVVYRDLNKSAASLGARHDQTIGQNNLGLIHEQIGQFAEAESEYRQALVMSKEQGDKNQAAIALAELAFLSIRIGDWRQADSYSNDSLQLAKQIGNYTLELQSLLAQGLVAAHRGEEERSEKLLQQVAVDPDHERRSTKWEAQTALANFHAQHGRADAAQSEYRDALETVRQARCGIDKEELRMPFFANATHVYDGYIDFLIEQGKTAEALKTADESRALILAEGLGTEEKKCLASEGDLDAHRLARQAKATILFYWLGGERSYLWAVTPDCTKLFTLPASAQIGSLVAAYRKSLLGPRDLLQSSDSNGTTLYQVLVAPAKDLIPAGGRVIVIDDGSLSGLNFETLIAPQPSPHYWIEDVTLQNASSLRLLAAQPKKRAPARQKLLLIGNSLSPTPEYGVLPHAAEEIRGVGGYFLPADEQVYEGEKATVASYLTNHPEQFSYIHFVAHGTASLLSPLDSAVVLSKTTQDAAYKLYARDIIAHPLNAELVTVSTCVGAGVRAYTGEGLVGLTWAFQRAGAHSVIGALWEVSDSSTPQLMDRMYAQLQKGSTPAVSLRTAKLSLLRSGGIFRKPYYWAAFQLYSGL